mmetsp:Transcript_7149/g.16368  ORF Transcript_7149/g.16368 Transcript_7149/m.16368 type:complete len:211 (-) Transcript_7149:1882-2514(-)
MEQSHPAFGPLPQRSRASVPGDAFPAQVPQRQLEANAPCWNQHETGDRLPRREDPQARSHPSGQDLQARLRPPQDRRPQSACEPRRHGHAGSEPAHDRAAWERCVQDDEVHSGCGCDGRTGHEGSLEPQHRSRQQVAAYRLHNAARQGPAQHEEAGDALHDQADEPEVDIPEQARRAERAEEDQLAEGGQLRGLHDRHEQAEGQGGERGG